MIIREDTTGRRASSMPVSVHALLREGTADLHREVEAAVAIFEPPLTLDRYRALLASFLGFYAPLEQRLAAAATLCGPLPFPLRDRTGLLERDRLMLASGRGGVQPPVRCSALPEIASREDLAGVLYVIEGASLGGQVLAREVQRTLGLAAGDGCAFFIGDGAETMLRWKNVLAWLDALPAAGAVPDAIVAAACATFSCFGSWLRRCE